MKASELIAALPPEGEKVLVHSSRDCAVVKRGHVITAPALILAEWEMTDILQNPAHWIITTEAEQAERASRKLPPMPISYSEEWDPFAKTKEA